MKFDQPRLPYAISSLEPVISPLTVEYHYGKHEKAYIDNLNKLIENTEFDNMALEEIIRKSDGAIFNNASQAWNHIFYFFQFSEDGLKEPSAHLREVIEKKFGSFDEFKRLFEEVGMKLFGSGWVWLCEDADNNLEIISTHNAGNPLVEGKRPLLVVDVWEHAYYLDYQNRRAEYLHKIWDIIDWNIIDLRFR